jgi:hypothetical protein
MAPPAQHLRSSKIFFPACELDALNAGLDAAVSGTLVIVQHQQLDRAGAASLRRARSASDPPLAPGPEHRSVYTKKPHWVTGETP